MRFPITPALLHADADEAAVAAAPLIADGMQSPSRYILPTLCTNRKSRECGSTWSAEVTFARQLLTC